jgi:hypothetical protein
MTQMIRYIETLELPEPPARRGAEAQGPPAAFQSGAQALAIGPQLTEFSNKVPQSIRPAISNGLLLGQLAADKATLGLNDPWTWFTTFNTVMGRIGWLPTVSEVNDQVISDKNAELRKAIIPIVTAIFGPAAAASSIILAVLNGLDSMNTDAPWLTVFERKSNNVQAAKFGLSYVDGGDGAGATLKTVYFALQASKALTQVLFFKLSTSDAKIKAPR